MKKFLQLYFLFFISITLNSQNKKTDSLKNVLKNETSKEVRLSILDSLNKILISKSSLEESLPFFIEMGSIAKDLDKNQLEAKAYKYISETHMKRMDSVQSLKYAKKALSINEENKNLKGYLIDINQLGRVYHHFQYYENAIETYNKGISKYEDNLSNELLVIISKLYSNSSAAYQKLGRTYESINAILKGVEIAEKTNNPNEKSYGFYVLGYKYMGLKNYEKAEEYFLKSLEFSDSVSLHTYINMNHHGLGINYSRWGKYDKALYHNKVALDFYRKQGNKLYEFDVLNNTAVVYQRMHETDSVIFYGKLALKIAKEINHKLAITGANLTLSNAYLNKQQYNKAEEILLEVAKDTINPKVIDINSKASVYSNLSLVYEGQKNYKKSLEFHKKFKTLNDSIEKDILESKYAELETSYQTEIKERKIEKLRADNAEKDVRNTILFFSLLFSLLGITALIAYLYRRLKKAKEREYKYLKEVEAIDRIKEEQLQTIEQQYKTIDNLKSDVSELKQKIEMRYNELENKFHDYLKEQYDISKKQLHYWIDLTNGLRVKDMEEVRNNSKNNLSKIGLRLYAKIKVNRNINLDIHLSKMEVIQFYKEERLKFDNK